MDYPRIELSELKTFAGRCRTLYKIQQKNGQLVPFNFLQAQAFFDDIVEEEFKRTKREFGYSSCKIIAVKPRQVGWTTYSNIRSLDTQIHDNGSNGAIAAHDNETTELVFRIYNRAFENLPDYVIPTINGKELTVLEFFKEELPKDKLDELVHQIIESEGEAVANDYFNSIHKIKIKPRTKAHSGRQIEFPDNDSFTTIFTAGKGDAGGKAGTLRRIHFTEAANYKEYDLLLTSINPAVPEEADNVFYIIESTANGTTGEGEGFYEEWTLAVAEWEDYQQGKNQTYGGFRPVFIPWYMIDEYEKPLAGGKYETIDKIDFGSPEDKKKFLVQEQTLLTKGIYNPLTKQTQIITPEKINWYRYAIKTKAKFSYNSARRYYPTTPEDAFIASENSFFDSSKANEAKTKKLNDPPKHELGEIEWDDSIGDLIFVPSSTGSLKIFKTPEKNWNNRYVVGSDIGRGYDDGDYSCAYVWDRLTQQYVAVWHGKVDQDQFAEILMNLGLYYNEALLVPEANLDTVINIIKPDGINPYIGEIYLDENLKNEHWGFLTTASSRQMLIESHKSRLRDNPLGYDVLPDVETINEHLAFIRKKTQHKVKYEAADGHYDDRVIGSALAWFGDDWWDKPVKEYKPNKLVELISAPSRHFKKKMKYSQVGRR